MQAMLELLLTVLVSASQRWRLLRFHTLLLCLNYVSDDHVWHCVPGRLVIFFVGLLTDHSNLFYPLILRCFQNRFCQVHLVLQRTFMPCYVLDLISCRRCLHCYLCGRHVLQLLWLFYIVADTRFESIHLHNHSYWFVSRAIYHCVLLDLSGFSHFNLSDFYSLAIRRIWRGLIQATSSVHILTTHTTINIALLPFFKLLLLLCSQLCLLLLEYLFLLPGRLFKTNFDSFHLAWHFQLM